jgi:hypothetical protein
MEGTERLKIFTGHLPVRASARAYRTTTCTLINCFTAIVESFGQALRPLLYMDVSPPLPDRRIERRNAISKTPLKRCAAPRG